MKTPGHPTAQRPVPSQRPDAATTHRGRPLDRLFALYAVVSGAALLFPHRSGGWLGLAALHIAAALLALHVGTPGGWLSRLGRRAPRAARVLADWYPLALIPALYTELAILNRAVHGGRYFDTWVIGWEQAIFGGQPSRALAAAVPDLLLSEVLHGAYISYYLIIYGPPLVLYLRGRREEFGRVVFGLMLAFFVHYLFFIYLPVQGPRYLFPPPGGELARGPMYGLAHAILEAGSSRGAAFPSSHVAVSVVQTALAVRALPRLFAPLAVLTTGLAIGAVYGGFHYATDVVVGLVLGLILAALAPSVQRRL